jgi:hypothetical protein
LKSFYTVVNVRASTNRKNKLETPVPANWASVSAAEHFFLRHFDSKKFPGSGNMVTCLKLRIKEDVTWSEFMSRMKLAARAVQMENPTLQVGAAARHRHTRRVKWYWVRQPEVIIEFN